MKENLWQAAKRYVEVIETIEKTTDPKELRRLEEKKDGTSLEVYGHAEKAGD